MASSVRNLKLPLLKVINLKVGSALFSASAIYKEEKIKIDKWDLNYVKVGNGPHTVFCLPGAFGSIWRDFKPQVEGLDKEKFTIIVWDPPGYGKSRPPEKVFHKDFYETDADLANKLMKALKIPKYSLLGWSDGGKTAMVLAAKYPDVMNKIVIWATRSLVLEQELEVDKSMRDINNWSKYNREAMIAMYGEELFRKLCSSYVDNLIDLFNTRNGDIICSAILKDIKCPTLILNGQKDPLVHSSHVSHLQTNIQGSRIHLYPDGKHNIHLAYPEDFNKRVEKFLLHGTSKV